MKLKNTQRQGASLRRKDYVKESGPDVNIQNVTSPTHMHDVTGELTAIGPNKREVTADK